jgi:hypothetical protein
MNIPVTTILASLLAVVFLVLSLRVIRLRVEKKVAHGDGGDEELRRAIRGHANWAEYAPIGILLVLFAELQSVNIILLAALAAAFALGRSFHAYGFAFTAGNVFLRVRGMQLTFFTIAILAVLNIALLVFGWIGAGG